MPLISPAALALLSLAATGPEPDPPPAPVCPQGDGPTGALDLLTHVSRLRSLTVKNGHGVLDIEDVYENRTASAASLDVDLNGIGVIRAASIEEPGFAPRRARLEDVAAASAAFEEFRSALLYGVAREAAINSAERAALLVTNEHRDTGGRLTVMMACSVRSVVVRTEMLVPSVPIDGAWQFSLPAAPDEGVADRVSVHSTTPMRAFFEDNPIRADDEHDVAASIYESIDGGAHDDGAVTITVRPLNVAKLRTRGYALRVDPTEAPPEPEPAPESEPEPDDEDTADRDTADVDDEKEPVSSIVVARAELDLPRPLSNAPPGLRIVFVIDNSVSVTSRGVDKALQVMHAVLDEAPPDARFAVVTAARKPKVVVAPWQKRDDRDVAAIDVENGSDVLAALAKARAIVSDVGSEEVGRIIAISDMQLRLVDTDERVAKGFGGEGAPLTHMITIADGDIEESFLWARAFADDEPRAAGPESTGGIWIDAGDEDESALFPHLIAPTRIDQPRIVLGGVDVLSTLSEATDDGVVDHGQVRIVHSPRDEETWDGDRHLPDRLHAGSGLRVDVILHETHDAFVRFNKARAGRELHIEGSLWATRFDERVERDESLLGLVATTSLADDLHDDLVRTIARRAKTVSRVTSLVDVPAFRPAAPEGAMWGGVGYGCSCGCGCHGISGRGTSACGIGIAQDLKERDVLEGMLRDAARSCLVSRAVVDVEFGDLEILDVTEREGGACVVERMWQERLDLVARVPGAFQGHRQMTIGVDVR